MSDRTIKSSNLTSRDSFQTTVHSLARIDHVNRTTCLPNTLMILLKSGMQTERLTRIGLCVGWSDTPQRGREQQEEAGEVMA